MAQVTGLTPLQREALDMLGDEHHRVMVQHSHTQVLVTDWRSRGQRFPARVQDALRTRGYVAWQDEPVRGWVITEAGREALRESEG